MTTTGSNKRKATDFLEGDPEEDMATNIEILTTLNAFVERFDERADRLEQNLADLTKTVDELGKRNSFDRSPGAIVKASEDEEEDSSDEEEPDEDESNPWTIRCLQLREYRILNGHCKVPTLYKENPKLGQWVANQRKAYNMLKNGKKSFMTPERLAKLDSLGFNWGKKHPDPPSWDEMVEKAKNYYQKLGDIPFNKDNPTQLAKWAAVQRKERKRLNKGLDSLLTLDQIERLNEFGFKWKNPK